MSSESYVDVQDSATPTKKMRTIQNTVAGRVEQSEVVVLSTDGLDSYDARQQGAANTIGNAWPVKVTDGTNSMPTMDAAARRGYQQITDGTNSPVIRNSTPSALDQGLVTRLAGSGNTVTFAAGAAVTVQGSLATAAAQATEGIGYVASSLKPFIVFLEGSDATTNFPTPILEVGGGLAVSGNQTVLQQDVSGNLKVIEQNPIDILDRAARLLGRLNGNVSAGNSSTTLLGISAVFTGTYDDVKDYAAITISVFSDQASAAGGLEFDWSHDGVNLDASSTTSVAASSGRAFSITPRARFFRIKYTNGAVGQTVFRLGTVYHPTGSGLISRPYSQSLDQDNYAQQTRSVTDGYDGSVFQHIGAKTGQPAATDYGLVTRGLVYRNPLLGLYYGESGNLTVLASAHAATAGFFWLVNTSSTVKVYIRSIGFVWSGTAATAFPTSPRITVERITFTGTPSGATLTPAKRASTDAANTATLRTASTGMTITAGAVIESFLVGSILTAVGAVSVPEEIWQSPDDDGMILLGQNEGIVIRQADAGTAADSRKAVMTIAWEER